MSRHHARWAWHRASKAAKVRAEIRCEKCGWAGRLQTHHKRPKWKGGDDSPENLIVLCGRCHLAAHRRLGASRPRDPGPKPASGVRRGLSPEWRDLVDELGR